MRSQHFGWVDSRFRCMAVLVHKRDVVAIWSSIGNVYQLFERECRTTWVCSLQSPDEEEMDKEMQWMISRVHCQSHGMTIEQVKALNNPWRGCLT